MKKIVFILFILWTPIMWGQKYKYGKVSKAELEEKAYPLDSTVNAAILYSERKTNFEYSYDEGFIIRDTYYTRLKIYNKEGYDYATKEISTYHDINGSVILSSLKATTYNLEDGKKVKTKLNRKKVFKERENKYYDNHKFTMPNLKPGCIVEWKYSVESPFYGKLDEVVLQEDIPIKKIMVHMNLPQYFSYNTKVKGYLPIDISTDRKERKISYTYHYHDINTNRFVNGSSELVFDEEVRHIEKINIPALEKNVYKSGNINNYRSGVVYELSVVKLPNQPTKSYAADWNSVVEKIFFSASFGDQLKKEKHFKADLDAALKGVITPQDKIKTILQLVKDKIKWNEYYGYHTEEGVKKSYTKGFGNVADINLNLVAMLRYAGLDANPVLVSTINHGIPIFPTRHGFNYVIARVLTPEGSVLLDATEKHSSPNVLPERVLNFKGRAVKENGRSDWVPLYPQTFSISKTAIKAKFTDEGFTGIARKELNNNYGLHYRKGAYNKSKDLLIEWIDERIEDVEVTNGRVNNIDNLDKNVLETIQFETESFYEEIGGKIYISPLLYLQSETNPFKSDTREYPVFYNKPWANVAIIDLSFPEGYKVESLPDPVQFDFADNIGTYQYAVTNKGNTIKIEVNMLMNSPIIAAENYTTLKEFYKNIVTKEAEKIVLVKE